MPANDKKVQRSITLDADVDHSLERLAEDLRTTVSAMINETMAEKLGLIKVKDWGKK